MNLRRVQIELALAALSIASLACGARANLDIIDFNFGVESDGSAGNISLIVPPFNRGVSLTKLTTGEIVYQTGSPMAYGGTGWSNPVQISP